MGRDKSSKSKHKSSRGRREKRHRRSPSSSSSSRSYHRRSKSRSPSIKKFVKTVDFPDRKSSDFAQYTKKEPVATPTDSRTGGIDYQFQFKKFDSSKAEDDSYSIPKVSSNFSSSATPNPNAGGQTPRDLNAAPSPAPRISINFSKP
jgi:hypothetical protein